MKLKERMEHIVNLHSALEILFVVVVVVIGVVLGLR
jgi:hypothetical protein